MIEILTKTLAKLQPETTQLLDRLLPNACLLCDGSTSHTHAPICPACLADLPYLQRQSHLCQTCALPLAVAAPLCGHCLHEPPAFSQCQIPFLYGHPIDALIHRFKYQRQLSSGRLLAELMAEQLQQQNARMPDFLVPVPMHWQRRWQRGFNQTEVLAQQLAKHFALELLDACRAPLPTHSQQGLGRAERLKNLRRTFAPNPKAKPKLQQAHIALVDDVVTTGATARCLSELLRKQGAQQVDIWALARTPEQHQTL